MSRTPTSEPGERPHTLLLVINFNNSNISEFISEAEAEQQAMTIKSTFAAWNYESNISDETKEPYLKLQKDSSKLTKQHGKEAQKFDISSIQVYRVYSFSKINLHLNFLFIKMFPGL